MKNTNGLDRILGIVQNLNGHELKAIPLNGDVSENVQKYFSSDYYCKEDCRVDCRDCRVDCRDCSLYTVKPS